MPHLLCILIDLATAEGVLTAGDQLARHLGIGVRVLRPRPDRDPDFMPTEEVMTAQRQTAFERREDARTDGFARLIARLGFSTPMALDEVRGDVADVVTSAASEAVMAVAGAAIGDNRAEAAVCVQNLLKAGHGVVVVPAAPVPTVGRHPAVVWTEAGQDETAIETAMPILLSATRVDVLIRLDGRQQAVPPIGLVERLRKEGLDTFVVEVDLKGRHQGQALLEEARALNCDLLVMGAHAANWLHDALFGNVSSDVLSDADLPVLMQG